MFEHAAKLNFEGIISKRADAPYKSERGEAWVKIKTVQREKFPVVGFVKDPSGVAALYLGKQEGKELVYMGKVGTGWSRTVSNQIRKQLDTVVSPRSKLTTPIRKPKATWVEPTFVADIEYRDITSEGLLRASSFRGSLGNRLSQRAVSPLRCTGCLYRVELIAKHALQFGSAAVAAHRDQKPSAVQTTCHFVDDILPCAFQLWNVIFVP
jgi:ATP-dependent DNA ligase